MHRIGLAGIDGSHAEAFLTLFNREARHPGLRIVAAWGSGADRIAELRALEPHLAAPETLEGLIATSDAVIVGDRHGDLHLPHVLPCLAAGRPVFVDKPLACREADGAAILAAAARAGQPLLSASALRWQPQVQAAKEHATGRFRLEAWGSWYPQNDYGGMIYYAIHTAEMVQEICGTAWQDLTLAAGGAEPVFRFRAGQAEVTLSLRTQSEAPGFGVVLATAAGRQAWPIPLPDDYMAPVAARIARMLAEHRARLTAEQMLAPLRFIAEIDSLLRTAT
jgi:predicted dehydrogenase